MASRAAPCNMLMRTTLSSSANAVSYHGLGWLFPKWGGHGGHLRRCSRHGSHLQKCGSHGSEASSGFATISLEDMPRARRPALAAPLCLASVGGTCFLLGPETRGRNRTCVSVRAAVEKA